MYDYTGFHVNFLLLLKSMYLVSLEINNDKNKPAKKKKDSFFEFLDEEKY